MTVIDIESGCSNTGQPGKILLIRLTPKGIVVSFPVLFLQQHCVELRWATDGATKFAVDCRELQATAGIMAVEKLS